MYTKTKQVMEGRRANAEKRQAVYAALPLKDKVKAAGAKELAKLISKYGNEEVAKFKEAV